MNEGGRRRIDEHPERLYRAVAVCSIAGAALWLVGWFLLRAADYPTGAWNTIWALTGISFLGAVIIPIPGTSTTALILLRDQPALALVGVVGAAVGGTIGAGLLLALGHTGRAVLRRRSEKSARARRMLEWSKKLARKWTYAGVAVLMIPPFLPRMPVLYAAVLAHLKTAPFLVAVFVGTLLRNLVVLAVVYGIFALPFL